MYKKRDATRVGRYEKGRERGPLVATALPLFCEAVFTPTEWTPNRLPRFQYQLRRPAHRRVLRPKDALLDADSAIRDAEDYA